VPFTFRWTVSFSFFFLKRFFLMIIINDHKNLHRPFFCGGFFFGGFGQNSISFIFLMFLVAFDLVVILCWKNLSVIIKLVRAQLLIDFSITFFLFFSVLFRRFFPSRP
jgi:hypothetical protein